MTRKILVPLFTACLLTSTATFAEQTPNWNYGEIGYVKGDADALSNADFTGFHLEGSVSVYESIFVMGRYREVSDSYNGLNAEASLTSIGLGYHHAMEKNTDFFTTVSYVQVTSEASYMSQHESSDSSGYEIGLGVRSMLTDSFELMTALLYADIEEADTSFKVGAFYHLTQNIAVGVNYVISTENEFMTLSARYSF